MRSSKNKAVWLIGAILTTLIGVTLSIIGSSVASAATSGVTFAGTPQTGGATASWQIGFATANGSAGILAGGNTVTVTFDPAFAVPSTPAVTLNTGFANCSATASATGSVVTILLAGGTCDHPKNSAATLSIAGITNAPVGSYPASSFSVATSKDAAAGSPSAPVILAVGAAAKLAYITAPPTTGTAGSPLAPAISVQVQDSSGNAVSTAGITVTLAVSAGVIDSGASATTNSSGRATFSGVIINTAATGLTMTASASGLTATPASAPFNITVAVSNGAALTDSVNDGAGSGVKSVSYYYCVGYSGGCTSANWTLIGSSSTAAGSYLVTWNGQPANGAYRLVVVGTDKVNNVSQASASIPVTVAN
ncbi:hypothetical protein [Kribbella sp. NPDC006257]|uniref:hypothetical protein n=1 Tax=Kribbella sp. NPDC006257 TaxID=3156738 RepID=UPI0033A82CD5